jgi:hypothetical protein
MDNNFKMYTVQWWFQQGSRGSDPHTPPIPRKETVFGCVKCSKKNSALSVRDHHAVLDVNIVEE